jgi:hypothetical protein
MAAVGPALEGAAGRAGAGEKLLAEGKPSRRDDPGPVKQPLTTVQRKEIAEKRAAVAARNAKLDEAGASAVRDLKAAQVGVVRDSLFDADDWKREHTARQGRMEQTFSRLYKPQAGEYWTKKAKAPPRKPPSATLPAYTNALPAALSLAHPSSRELPSDDEEEEEAVPAPAPAAPAQADFDPMAEPRRFYAEFKGRVAALKVGVKDNPTDRPTQAAMLPRAADEFIAEATRKSPPPPPPPPPPKVEAPSWSVHGNIVSLTSTNPILDEDFDVEPSLVYTDSAHYLADHGVNIPMWDELDGELAALDAAHSSAMKALAIRADAPPTDAQPPVAGLPGSV